MNGSAYKNGAIIIAWEVTSALALIAAAVYFIPKYLSMGLTTIPEFLEKRFDQFTRTAIAFLLIVSFVSTLLPIVLYTGALNIESLFGISDMLGVSRDFGLFITILLVGILGSIYAIFGGLKMIAHTDTINGFGLLAAGLAVPFLALWDIGEGSIGEGIRLLMDKVPEKFAVISSEPSYGAGSRDSILPFSVLFTGLMINQLYFWTMHQSIIQRALGAVSLKEAQKGLLFTGVLKILIPLVIVLPGIIGFYYFGNTYYDEPDLIYPMLIKKVLPSWMTGFFVAVVVGAVLSTFNSALNSAATVFSLDIYQQYFSPNASEKKLVWIGKIVSAMLAIFAIGIAPFVANAPDGLYQLLQQLNGIFFIPMASVIIAGLFIPKISAAGAKAGLVFGLLFYIILNLIIEVDLHFVHLWGIEFVLNVLVMWIVSRWHPVREPFHIQDVGAVEMEPWRYTQVMSIGLVVVTVLIYVYFGMM
jgi:SSS family solute:Na+ symporter